MRKKFSTLLLTGSRRPAADDAAGLCPHPTYTDVLSSQVSQIRAAGGQSGGAGFHGQQHYGGTATCARTPHWPRDLAGHHRSEDQDRLFVLASTSLGGI
jgi:hypothetical protein